MAITLRQLEIFIAVAETAQVTKASKKLFITQSAVSMALAEFENQLGGSLFDRHGRSLLLNSRGRYLLPLAKDIVCQVSSIETMMSERNDKLSGDLDIVASASLGNYILPYLIGAFRKVHPRVHIHLLVSNTHWAETYVTNGDVDVGFVEGRVAGSEVLEVHKWFEDELVVIVGPSDPLAHNKVFDVKKDIENTRWIVREKGSGTEAVFRERMSEYLDKMQVVMEMNNPEAIKRAVESGVGVACLSSLTVCREVENGWLRSLRVAGVNMKRKLQIISRKDMEKSVILSEFLAFCEVMSTCDDERICLSSPWKLQSLLSRRSVKNR